MAATCASIAAASSAAESHSEDSAANQTDSLEESDTSDTMRSGESRQSDNSRSPAGGDGARDLDASDGSKSDATYSDGTCVSEPFSTTQRSWRAQRAAGALQPVSGDPAGGEARRQAQALNRKVRLPTSIIVRLTPSASAENTDNDSKGTMSGDSLTYVSPAEYLKHIQTHSNHRKHSAKHRHTGHAKHKKRKLAIGDSPELYFQGDKGDNRYSYRSAGSICLSLSIVAVIVAVIGIVTVAAYLGVHTTEHGAAVQYEMGFAGEFRVESGDFFHQSLVDTSSEGFQRTANRYQHMLEVLFGASYLSEAFRRAQVHQFLGGDGQRDSDSLRVFFRIHLDRRKIPLTVLDSEEAVRDVITQEVMSLEPRVFRRLSVDIDSIRVSRLRTPAFRPTLTADDGPHRDQKTNETNSGFPEPTEKVVQPDRVLPTPVRTATVPLVTITTMTSHDVPTSTAVYLSNDGDVRHPEVHGSDLSLWTVRPPRPSVGKPPNHRRPSLSRQPPRKPLSTFVTPEWALDAARPITEYEPVQGTGTPLFDKNRPYPLSDLEAATSGMTHRWLTEGDQRFANSVKPSWNEEKVADNSKVMGDIWYGSQHGGLLSRMGHVDSTISSTSPAVNEWYDTGSEHEVAIPSLLGNPSLRHPPAYDTTSESFSRDHTTQEAAGDRAEGVVAVNVDSTATFDHSPWEPLLPTFYRPQSSSTVHVSSQSNAERNQPDNVPYSPPHDQVPTWPPVYRESNINTSESSPDYDLEPNPLSNGDYVEDRYGGEVAYRDYEWSEPVSYSQERAPLEAVPVSYNQQPTPFETAVLASEATPRTTELSYTSNIKFTDNHRNEDLNDVGTAGPLNNTTALQQPALHIAASGSHSSLPSKSAAQQTESTSFPSKFLRPLMIKPPFALPETPVVKTLTVLSQAEMEEKPSLPEPIRSTVPTYKNEQTHDELAAAHAETIPSAQPTNVPFPPIQHAEDDQPVDDFHSSPSGELSTLDEAEHKWQTHLSQHKAVQPTDIATTALPMEDSVELPYPTLIPELELQALVDEDSNENHTSVSKKSVDGLSPNVTVDQIPLQNENAMLDTSKGGAVINSNPFASTTEFHKAAEIKTTGPGASTSVVLVPPHNPFAPSEYSTTASPVEESVTQTSRPVLQPVTSYSGVYSPSRPKPPSQPFQTGMLLEQSAHDGEVEENAQDFANDYNADAGDSDESNEYYYYDVEFYTEKSSVSSIFDMFSTKKPLVLDTDVVTSTSVLEGTSRPQSIRSAAGKMNGSQNLGQGRSITGSGQVESENEQVSGKGSDVKEQKSSEINISPLAINATAKRVSTKQNLTIAATPSDELLSRSARSLTLRLPQSVLSSHVSSRPSPTHQTITGRTSGRLPRGSLASRLSLTGGPSQRRPRSRRPVKTSHRTETLSDKLLRFRGTREMVSRGASPRVLRMTTPKPARRMLQDVGRRFKTTMLPNSASIRPITYREIGSVTEILDKIFERFQLSAASGDKVWKFKKDDNDMLGDLIVNEFQKYEPATRNPIALWSDMYHKRREEIMGASNFTSTEVSITAPLSISSNEQTLGVTDEVTTKKPSHKIDFTFPSTSAPVVKTSQAPQTNGHSMPTVAPVRNHRVSTRRPVVSVVKTLKRPTTTARPLIRWKPVTSTFLRLNNTRITATKEPTRVIRLNETHVSANGLKDTHSTSTEQSHIRHTTSTSPPSTTSLAKATVRPSRRPARPTWRPPSTSFAPLPGSIYDLPATSLEAPHVTLQHAEVVAEADNEVGVTGGPPTRGPSLASLLRNYTDADGPCRGAADFRCATSGQCVPSLARCNSLLECGDGSDEDGCTCADQLRAQFLERKICDGVVDCHDKSDEQYCDWCGPDQYICSGARACVNSSAVCDGVYDCPSGDDEHQCVTLAATRDMAGDTQYQPAGYMMVRRRGRWGPLCMDNFDELVQQTQTSLEQQQSSWSIQELGRAVCSALTYKSTLEVRQSNSDDATNQLELASQPEVKDGPYFQIMLSDDIASQNSSLKFEEASCPRRTAVHITCDGLKCGLRPLVKQRPTARIVGGRNTAPGAWPWQAAMYRDGEYQCGATLIADQWLLSAGHCFLRSRTSYWVARLGAYRRGSSLLSPVEAVHVVAYIVVHPDYQDIGYVNDIALLKLRQPVSLSDYVRPVCLPPPRVDVTEGAICTVVGWGQLFEAGRIFPDTLQEVQLPLISSKECKKRTVFLPLYRITENMFCAGYDRGGRDACLGDSGGPLMCQEATGEWTLQGITSNGYGCARAARPGVYTKVSNYMGWIEDVMSGPLFRRRWTRCHGHRCPLGRCLDSSRVCDGVIHCSDASDERDCTT